MQRISTILRRASSRAWSICTSATSRISRSKTAPLRQNMRMLFSISSNVSTLSITNSEKNYKKSILLVTKSKRDLRGRHLEDITIFQLTCHHLGRSKRDFEARLKGEMNAEIVRIREFELSTIKMEEQEKHRKSMEEYRVEIEKSYRDKLNKLRERESTAIEKVE